MVREKRRREKYFKSYDMSKKNVVIFGGTSGLGHEVASALSPDQGAYEVFVVGSTLIDLRKDCTAMVDTYFENIKPDVLVFFSNFTVNSFLHKQSSIDIENQINVNIKGCLTVVSGALKHMRKNNYGRIIIASSIIEEISKPGTSIYAACKGFYETLVKNIALENGAFGINANCLKLGYMDGGLTYSHLTEEIRNDALNFQIPAKRFGKIDELVSGVEFLIDNEYVNGAVIRMAGGL